MKHLIAWLFGLYTIRDIHEREDAVRRERMKYYQTVLKHLHANGTLPPNCDLLMPKATLRLENAEKGTVVAEGGMWKHLPADGEILRVKYTPQAV